LLVGLNGAFGQGNAGLARPDCDLTFEPTKTLDMESARTTATCTADFNKYYWGNATRFTIFIWDELNGAAQYIGNGIRVILPIFPYLIPKLQIQQYENSFTIYTSTC
jgi:hypothetical protein